MRKIICGSCDFPASAHTSDNNVVYTYPDGFKVECFRDFDQIGNASWYSDSSSPGLEFSDYATESLDGSSYSVLNHDVSGPAAGRTDEDPYEYEDFMSELAKLDRWSDATHRVSANPASGTTQSWVCTSVLGEPTGEYVLQEKVDPKSGLKTRSKAAYDSTGEQSNDVRNAYVENNPGFLAIKLLDEVITDKYHRKLLNVYFDKDNNLRCGSIRFTGNITSAQGVTGWLKASCVRNDCSGFLWVNVETATREDMETFVWACIAHGNNHAAKWFTTRTEDVFTHKYHVNFKDKQFVLDAAPSNLKGEKSATFYELDSTLGEPVLTDDEVVQFLLEHNSLCQDSKCECSSRLEELVPALKTKVAA